MADGANPGGILTCTKLKLLGLSKGLRVDVVQKYSLTPEGTSETLMR